MNETIRVVDLTRFDELGKLYALMVLEWRKALIGNKSAGTGFRKYAKEMEKLCKELRKLSLEKHR